MLGLLYIYTCCTEYRGNCVCHAGVGVVIKELAAHKEMVAELRKQLGEKENELQVYRSWYIHVYTCMCMCIYIYIISAVAVHLNLPCPHCP